MTDHLIERQNFGAVARLVLNDPAHFNALSDAMLAALSRALDAMAQDPKVRVVILAARGKAFCAGHDLKEMQAARGAADSGAAYFADLFTRCADVMQKIVALPQPVIAEVQGIATAAGCQLVASCDMAVAAEGLRFGVNGINIGLFCATPMVALSRNVPAKVAFEMLTTGEFISSARAREVGLVNRICPAADLEAETLALAKTVAAKLSGAVKIGKRTFYDQLDLPLDQAYALAGAAMVENMLWRDTREGITAFIEKRQPDWAEGQ